MTCARRRTRPGCGAGSRKARAISSSPTSCCPTKTPSTFCPRIKRLRPELPIVVMSAQNNILTAITATERGAFEYLPKPFDLKELTAVVQRALAQPRTKRAEVAVDPSEERLPLIGRSPAMQEIYRVIARLTQADLTVMIIGRKRHRQGTGRARAARLRQAAERRLRRGQHGGDSQGAGRKRIVRP